MRALYLVSLLDPLGGLHRVNLSLIQGYRFVKAALSCGNRGAPGSLGVWGSRGNRRDKISDLYRLRYDACELLPSNFILFSG